MTRETNEACRVNLSQVFGREKMIIPRGNARHEVVAYLLAQGNPHETFACLVPHDSREIRRLIRDQRSTWLAK